MSRLPDKAGPRFVELTERRQEFVVCSTVEWWVSHWDPQRMRSRRCGGIQCALCAIGSPKVTRFVVLAVDSHNREWLLEFRERHRKLVERLEASVSNGQGVRIVGREIKLLVESFGLPALIGPSAVQPGVVNLEHEPVPGKLR